MIEIGIEMLSLGNFDSERGFEVIPSRNIIYVIDSSRSHSQFREIGGPYTSISVFGLIDGEIGGVDSIRDNSISFIPFLIIILFEVMMSGVNSEIISYHSR